MVVGIAALAANERVVFLAKNTLTDAEFDGSCHRISNSRFRADHIAAVASRAQTAFARMPQVPPQHGRSVQRVSSRPHNKKSPGRCRGFDFEGKKMTPGSILCDHRPAEFIVYTCTHDVVGDARAAVAG
jgi:hypothetical protein